MKILHVLYSGLGGHGNVFFSLVSADVHKVNEYEALFLGVEEIRSEYIERCKRLGIPFRYIKKKEGRHLSFFFTVFKEINSNKSDIVFIHGSTMITPAWLANLVSFKKKKKLIVRETQSNQLKSLKERASLKIAMFLSDKIVFLSQEYAEEVKNDLGLFFKHDVVTIIPNGINLKNFNFVYRSLDKQKVINIGMLSRIVNIKDHSTLVRAVQIISSKFPEIKIQLFIAGDGEMLPKLANEVNMLALNEKVIFLGQISDTQIPGFLNSLHIYVHASFGETMSTSIMQAMACGKAIIASDVKGINNMITHSKNGILVPVKSENDLANEIVRILNDEELYKSLCYAAYETAVAKFSNFRMFEEYQKIFSDEFYSNK